MPQIGRKRTDMAFRYPQMRGNVSFSWGNTPRLHLPKIKQNLCLTSAPPIKLDDGSTFVAWRQRVFTPKTINDLPPLVGERQSGRITAATMLEIRAQHLADPISNSVTRLARMYSLSTAFINMCIRKRKEQLLAAK